jgi:hypothetical protein
MNRHSLHYLDLNHQPPEREPGPLSIVAGAAFALCALYLLTVFLFSL